MKKTISPWVFILPLLITGVVIFTVFLYRMTRDGSSAIAPEVERAWVGFLPSPKDVHYDEPNVYIVPSGIPDAERLGTMKELQDVQKDNGANDMSAVYAEINSL